MGGSRGEGEPESAPGSSPPKWGQRLCQPQAQGLQGTAPCWLQRGSGGQSPDEHGPKAQAAPQCRRGRTQMATLPLRISGNRCQRKPFLSTPRGAHATTAGSCAFVTLPLTHSTLSVSAGSPTGPAFGPPGVRPCAGNGRRGQDSPEAAGGSREPGRLGGRSTVPGTGGGSREPTEGPAGEKTTGRPRGAGPASGPSEDKAPAVTV